MNLIPHHIFIALVPWNELGREQARVLEYDATVVTRSRHFGGDILNI